jgi:hypothetical protein
LPGAARNIVAMRCAIPARGSRWAGDEHNRASLIGDNGASLGQSPALKGRSLRRRHMTEAWQYQIRIYLPEGVAQAARETPNAQDLQPLAGVLAGTTRR